MTDILALDRASVRTTDADGHMHISESPISKVCVNPYRGEEIPDWQSLGLDPQRIYRLLRDPAELEKAASSFEGKPLLNTHRPQSAEDHDKDLTVGSVNGVRWDAPYLKAALHVWDKNAIDGIESDEQRQLSSGYRYRPDMTSGTFDGDPFDGVMRDIQGNHVALVEKGRAGPDVVVGDSAIEPEKDHRPMAKKVLTAKAAAAKNVLAAHLRPLIAQDADIGGLVKLIDALEPVEGQEADQGDEPVAVDGDTEAQIKAILGENASPELIAKLVALIGKPAAPAQDEPPPAAKKDDVAVAPNDGKVDVNKETDSVTKPAMDAAIAAATTAAVNQTIVRLNGVRDAERAVEPYVGKLAVAMDSAETVYATALKALGVDVAGVHPSAFAAILRAQPVPGAAPARKPTMAADSAAAASFATRFPMAAPLRTL